MLARAGLFGVSILCLLNLYSEQMGESYGWIPLYVLGISGAFVCDGYSIYLGFMTGDARGEQGAWITNLALAWLVVTESARACSYDFSKEVPKIVEFWLLPV